MTGCQHRQVAKVVSVSTRLPFPVPAVTEFVTDEQQAYLWLDYLDQLSVTPGAAVRLRDRPGEVVESRTTASTVRVVVDLDDGSPSGARVTLSFTTLKGGATRVRVTDLGSEEGVLAWWKQALKRLRQVGDGADRCRRRYRQAVVVVHGIGEQRSTATLRSFVKAVFPRTRHERHFVKPDYVSPLVGAATVSVPGRWSVHRPTTDVYELYWAHLMPGSTLGGTYRWAFRLLWRTPWPNITPSLRPHVVLARVVTIVGVTALVVTAVLVARNGAAGVALLPATLTALVAAVPALVWSATRALGASLHRGAVGSILGDAARYFDPSPGNVEVRQNVREAGVDLLEDLHARGRYDRIVVYGHSLGSVVAYDVLAHAWARRSRQHDQRPHLRTPCLRALEDAVNPRADRPVASPDVQELQQAAWREARRNGFSWLVTDLVTAGSPLAHARWLLNPEDVTLDERVRERSMPTCPPQTSLVRSPRPGELRNSFTFTHHYLMPDVHGSRSVLVPDHGALFATVRWTNLYFPLLGLTRGDPVGGPVAPVLGRWVRDVALPHPGGGLLGFVHTAYVDVSRSREHAQALRDALHLEVEDTMLRWAETWAKQPERPEPLADWERELLAESGGEAGVPAAPGLPLRADASPDESQLHQQPPVPPLG